MMGNNHRIVKCLKLRTSYLQLKCYILLGIVALLNKGCIDPVAPDFAFQEGLVYVEGFASTAQGTSFVTISVSAEEFGVDVVNAVTGATVVLTERDSGREVALHEIPGSYVPPDDFVVTPGESWLLDIRLEDGRHYRSTYETVAAAVPISDIEAEYTPELYFREASERYVPGHRIFIDFTDPAGDENYYYWRYRAFENLDNCERCYDGLFRDGKCIGALPGTHLLYYYDYKCESDCWKIRYPEEVNISDDRLINGKAVSSQLVANIPLYNKEDMVVELQQLSLSPKAFEYYKVLQDLVDNNSSLNAPPPAALLGNLTDQDNDENFVFGRFTVAATTRAYIYVDRTDIEEAAIDRMLAPYRESCEVCPPGSSCPIDCSPVATAPCTETRYRTAMMPPGWREQ